MSMLIDKITVVPTSKRNVEKKIILYFIWSLQPHNFTFDFKETLFLRPVIVVNLIISR